MHPRNSSLADLTTEAQEGATSKYWGTLKTLQESPAPTGKALKLYEEHGRFLVNFVALLDRYPHRVTKRVRESMQLLNEHTTKPQLESKEFPPHTMDNLRMRRMCDEILTLETPTFRSYSFDKIQEDRKIQEDGPGMWMRVLRTGLGTRINSIRLTNNPSVTTGGYFILAQMLRSAQMSPVSLRKSPIILLKGTYSFFCEAQLRAVASSARSLYLGSARDGRARARLRPHEESLAAGV